MSDKAKDQETAHRVFRDVVAVLEREDFDYAVGGGICTSYWTGGSGSIQDIDLVVREDDVPSILESLARDGYETMETEHSWLHKASRDGVTVDLMFELKNGTRVDDEFLAHRTKAELFGTTARVMAADDQVASLAATVSRDTVGQHWYSIVDIMANTDLDWNYVIERSRRIPLRMLSVVYFALGEKVPVAKGVTDRLRAVAAGNHDAR